MRGVRTLPLRSASGSANAAAIAAFLEAHEKVEWVRYPGLASHPDHARGAAAPGRPRRGDAHVPAARRRRRAWRPSRTTWRLCDIGVSLGDIHTLVYPQPKRGGLIRLSVGCEDVEDLLEDFELGLSFVA